MKKSYHILFIFFIITSLIFTACDDNEDQLTTLEAVSFDEIPQVTPNPIVLSQDAQNEPAVLISWSDVTFPIEEAPVEYAVQFDIPADTLGESAWENATTITAGSEVLSKSILTSNLNSLVKDLGLEAEQEGTIVLRVQATMDRTIYSNAASFEVTPYNEVVSDSYIYVPGAYQGWDPSTAASLRGTSQEEIYQGYLSFTDPAALEFKFTIDQNWNENYGGDGSGNLIFDGNNLSVPEVGSYQITADLNSLTWTAEPYSWGIIGTATPEGWDNDTDMTYNYVEEYWEFEGELVPGALKFRLNDNWDVNYGSQNNTDGIAYLDDPGAHDVQTAGNYLITFQIDEEDPNIAYYTLELL